MNSLTTFLDDYSNTMNTHDDLYAEPLEEQLRNRDKLFQLLENEVVEEAKAIVKHEPHHKQNLRAMLDPLFDYIINDHVWSEEVNSLLREYYHQHMRSQILRRLRRELKITPRRVSRVSASRPSRSKSKSKAKPTKKPKKSAGH